MRASCRDLAVRPAGFLVLAAALSGRAAAETLPPPPRAHFNDDAALVDREAAARLDAKLRAFESQTGHQVVVAILPRLPATSLEDFTVRTAQAWRVGRKGLDDGVVLFVFVADRTLRLEVGYGLEDEIPDALARRILDDVIAPRLRTGDAAAGLEAGVEAILAAIQGRGVAATLAAPAAPPAHA
jgi:uncharacterized protein